MSKRAFIDELKHVADLIDESALINTILMYARRGRATRVMVEQAIMLVDRHIEYATLTNDAAQVRCSMSLKSDLELALIEGLETLESPLPPGPEVTLVERPLAKSLLSAGHQLRRQHRCSFGIIDIYDLTSDEIIECKANGTASALGAAAGQLHRYKAAFPGAKLTIAVPYINTEAEWLANVLRQNGIFIIEVGQQ